MRVDDDGYFFFRGRKKQIIVHDASNIAPRRSKTPCSRIRASRALG
jgi:acyl-CoA synthetase (AMP-forming)/AMP-acid ligase II